MKKIYSLFMMFLLITTTVQAQQSPLTGTWQLDVTQSIALMESSTRQKFDNVDQSVKTRIEASMNGRVFSFAPNGELTIHWQAQGTPRTSFGSWQTSGGTLSITIEDDVQQYTYEVTANSHLMLRNTVPSGLFSNLYLTWKP